MAAVERGITATTAIIIIMGKKRQQRRKLRGSRRGGRAKRSSEDNGCGDGEDDCRRCSCDLFLELPKATTATTATERALLVKELKNRAQSLGYTHVALTHTIFGRPKPGQDDADVAISAALYHTTTTTTTTVSSKKRKLDDSFAPAAPATISNNHAKMTILRRLHSVVESVSDVSTFTPTNEALIGYDVVSLCPTNDATFQAACRNATAANILTIDYTQRGLKLPFSMSARDLQALHDRGGMLEVCLAPALLNLKHRKSLIHASREVIMACQSLSSSTKKSTLTIIVSSGSRQLLDGNTDMGVLALRSPGDIQNLVKVIMGFPDDLAGGCMSSAPMNAIRQPTRQQQRRHSLGGPAVSDIASVAILSRQEILKPTTAAPMKGESNATDLCVDKSKPPSAALKDGDGQTSDVEDDDEHGNDGYIAM